MKMISVKRSLYKTLINRCLNFIYVNITGLPWGMSPFYSDVIECLSFNQVSPGSIPLPGNLVFYAPVTIVRGLKICPRLSVRLSVVRLSHFTV